MGNNSVEKLYEIVQTLIGENGCPWDKKQTLSSIKQYFLEEFFELFNVVDGNPIDHKEELGDVIFHLVFQVILREKSGDFNFEDVINGISTKLIERHPHVFNKSESQSLSINEEIWEKGKHLSKKRKSMMDDIPDSLPALMKAEKIQRRAKAVGFDWPDNNGPMMKVKEELEETIEAINNNDIEAIKEEMGDLLFAVSNWSRHWNLNGELLLIESNKKFQKRFRLMEALAKEKNVSMEDLDLDAQEELWISAKNIIKEEKNPNNIHMK